MKNETNESVTQGLESPKEIQGKNMLRLSAKFLALSYLEVGEKFVWVGVISTPFKVRLGLALYHI